MNFKYNIEVSNTKQYGYVAYFEVSRYNTIGQSNITIPKTVIFYFLQQVWIYARKIHN